MDSQYIRLFRANQFSDCSQKCIDFLAALPQDLPSLKFAGKSALASIRPDQALAFFTKFCDLSPLGDPEVLKDMGNCFQMKADYQRAVYFYQQALALARCMHQR